MQQTAVPTDEIVYGFIPVGTGNDWVKMHNIPRDVSKAIAIIKAEKTTRQDIGLAKFQHNNQTQQRYFVNVAGMAYDAHVCRAASKRKTNALTYYLLIFKCLFEYASKQAGIILDDKEVANQHFYTINIGLCKYSGGGMQFVPHAEIDDGEFAVSFVDSIPKLKVIASTHYLYGGKIATFKYAKLFKAKHIKIEAVDDAPTLLELDGEFVGETPVEFEIIPTEYSILSYGALLSLPDLNSRIHCHTKRTVRMNCLELSLPRHQIRLAQVSLPYRLTRLQWTSKS